jgi:1,4-alpha-glucan branching enzyme
VPASQQYISPATPLGVTLAGGGATFRVWAPDADEVHVALAPTPAWAPSSSTLLVRDADGCWGGFFPGIVEGTAFRFWTRGPGGFGLKRDPRAAQLGFGYPDCDCFVTGGNTYPWHDAGFRPPRFHELIIYQLHIGVFHAWDGHRDIRSHRVSKFFDVVGRVEYLARLGINAVQPLPVVEWQGTNSRGYNNTDFFSPEMDYCVPPGDVAGYLPQINALLRAKGQPDLQVADLVTHGNQLKALVDLFHLYGIAVIFDVVYNHAGGPFDDQSMRFLERPWNHQWWDPDCYFIAGEGWAGGRIFDYTQGQVRQFLIDNARTMLDEYHGDGLRFDEVRVIRENGGTRFCRDLTNTLHYHKPSAILIAEDWSWDRAAAVTSTPDGLGFDAAVNDSLRTALRTVLSELAGGQSAHVHLDALGRALERPVAYSASWKAVVHLENHDLVDADRENPSEILPRVPALAHWDNRRDWLARSRSRLATALLLTAPGIPLLFMGEEFLEDKPWHNDPARDDLFIYWEGLRSPGAMRDFLRFTTDMCWLRRAQPALAGEGVRTYFVHENDRVLACHRWVEGVGRDAIVVASFSEQNRWGYPLPMPAGGFWREVFNSDAYDSLPAGGGYNPGAVGNPSGVDAAGPPIGDHPSSALIVLPANAVLVLAR